MDLFAIVCPQCGSNDVSVSEKSNDAVCNSCGTKFLITDKQPNRYEENAVYEPAKRADRKMKFKPLYSTDVFLRRAIIDIFQKKASLELLGGTVAPVKTLWKRMLCERAIADVDYSGSVGYYRQETYVDHEERCDNQTGKRYMVPVEKTRTVTDWRPISGQKRIASVTPFVENDIDQKQSSGFFATTPLAANFYGAFHSASEDMTEEDHEDDGVIDIKVANILHKHHKQNYVLNVVDTIHADDSSRLSVFTKREVRIETDQWRTPLYEAVFTAGDTVEKQYEYPICADAKTFGFSLNAEKEQPEKQQQEMRAMVEHETGALFWVSILASACAFVLIALLKMFRSVQMEGMLPALLVTVALATPMFGFTFSRAMLAKKVNSMMLTYEHKRIDAVNAMLKKNGLKTMTEQESGVEKLKANFASDKKSSKLFLLLSIAAAIVTIVMSVLNGNVTTIVISMITLLAWGACMFLISAEADDEVAGHRALKIISLILTVAAVGYSWFFACFLL